MIMDILRSGSDAGRFCSPIDAGAPIHKPRQSRAYWPSASYSRSRYFRMPLTIARLTTALIPKSSAFTIIFRIGFGAGIDKAPLTDLNTRNLALHFFQRSESALEDKLEASGKDCKIMMFLYIASGAQSHRPPFISRYSGQISNRSGNGNGILRRYGDAREGFGDRIIM